MGKTNLVRPRKKEKKQEGFDKAVEKMLTKENTRNFLKDFIFKIDNM